ncbi:phage Gp37Gp68 family protein (plasmid) [Nostoc sp. NIES-3756]|uniref:DUF5131 family protein n=1 Tax=Nostoc sp. NIES-3756 TaxID=1751286 RepID=UPI000721025B|nr:DUF5131 family protein [Nostoc sp. NIES-3756]BAT56700.1 phage Gp37Gp68 family protein [Nostoc sp. NIES-3756]
MSTNIEWTDLTDNIIRVKEGGWWCQKISEGCLHCYSEKINQNTFFGGNKLAYAGSPPELTLDTEIIRQWGFQRKPKKHFVASMTDVFGEWVPRYWQYEMLDGMFVAPKQTFQVLTKRPEIMAATVEDWLLRHGLDQLPSNIWIGVSTENQLTADERIPILMQIKATVRFLSCEPLLEEIDFIQAGVFQRLINDQYEWELVNEDIDWIIVGGESGTNSRPCHIEWIESIVQQCQQSKTPVFVKQLGSNAFLNHQQFDTRDKKGGNIQEFPEHLQIREFPVLRHLEKVK